MKNETTANAPMHALAAALLSLFILYLSGELLHPAYFLLYFPLTALFLQEETKWGIFAAFVFAASSLVVLGLGTLPSVAQTLALAALLAYLLRRKKDLFQVLVLGALLFTVLLLAEVVTARLRTGADFQASFRQDFQLSVDAAFEELAGRGLNPASLAQVRFSMQKLVQLLVQALPALFFIQGFLLSLVTVFAARSFLFRATGLGSPLALADFQISRRMTLFLLPTALVALALKEGSPFLETFAWNLLPALFFLYLVNGLARLNQSMRKKKMHTAMRTFLTVLLLSFVFSSFVLSASGLLSSIFGRPTYPKGGDHAGEE